MTANLNDLTPENFIIILDIAALGQQMGLDSVVIDAAINIANVESSLRFDPPPPENSSAWGPFQYLDDSWTTSWNRLKDTQEFHGFIVPDGLTAAATRFSYQWQIIVALNDLRSYYVGYPGQIASAWQDDVASLVARGFSPDSIFLQYAYLRHNTDSSVDGQVETV